MHWYCSSSPSSSRVLVDGWIVQFNDEVAPEKVTIWALCVENTTGIVAQKTFGQIS